MVKNQNPLETETEIEANAALLAMNEAHAPKMIDMGPSILWNNRNREED